MKRTKQQDIPSVLDRFELKYLIPYDWISPISDFASIYCSLDQYALNSSDGLYQISSLYLDSPSLYCLRQRQSGAEKRFNMRIRTYVESSDFCFFEIKYKEQQRIKKFRTRITDSNWPSVLSGNANSDLFNTPVGAMFYRLSQFYNTSPKVFTQYRRKAFISDVDEYARITFDMDLTYCLQNEFCLHSSGKDMISYDHELWFGPGCSVVLELKCYTTHVPLWMIDMIRHFNLERRRFSKYAAGVTEAMNLNVYDPLDRMEVN
ncbi:MAG: polyphosphate polymerase domain-containing protein [Desulfobacterales bacterium]|nr:polyphosphate polymerase domain-containing protein [Desulfobacterales bacterium]